MGLRRICRKQDFELVLDIKNDGFISPPTDDQKNLLLTSAMNELANDLEHLDTISKRFVEGSRRQGIRNEWAASQAKYQDSQLIIDGQQVMQDWERPYMEAMAQVATASHGDVLEIGFGMGISASYIQAMGVRSHTIIECNRDVQKAFQEWKRKYPSQDINLVSGRWQDVIGDLGEFDSIFFDTYPASEEEVTKFLIEDATFAAHFFPDAAAHLRKGGVFTYYSNEIDSLSRRHQRRLLAFFSSVSISVTRPLFPPKDCNYWWADSMVVVSATK